MPTKRMPTTHMMTKQKFAALWFGSVVLLAGCSKFGAGTDRPADSTASPSSPVIADQHQEQKITPTLNCQLWTQYGPKLDLTRAPDATASADLSTSAPVELRLKAEVADKTFEFTVRTKSFTAKSDESSSVAELEFSSVLTFINEVGTDETSPDAGAAKLIGNVDAAIFDKAELEDEKATYFRHVVCSVAN